jgi:hypothetical protein
MLNVQYSTASVQPPVLNRQCSTASAQPPVTVPLFDHSALSIEHWVEHSALRIEP